MYPSARGPKLGGKVGTIPAIQYIHVHVRYMCGTIPAIQYIHVHMRSLSITCFACWICLACVAKSLSGFEFNP